MSENIKIEEVVLETNEGNKNSRWKDGIKILVITGLGMYILGRTHGGRQAARAAFLSGYAHASKDITSGVADITRKVVDEVVKGD